jgi:geranylgeranyl diphosphate synthase, type II
VAARTTNSLFERYLERARRRIDAALDARLPRANREPRRLHAAIRYSIFAGGKRLRPTLCLLACESVSGGSAPALPAAAALEMIHTFSLIHDDLPGMDDDDWRRGRLANHKVFGEGMAILAGDALLALGFETIAKGPLGKARDPGALLRLVTEATGTGGMIGGQALDLLSEGKRLPLERVLAMHSRKTGMLIRGSLLLGAEIGGATPTAKRRFGEFGARVGLAFQIGDDLLNVRSNRKALGKAAGSDKARRKATAPGSVGVARAEREAERLLREARRIAAGLGRRAAEFESLTEFLIRRTS